MRISEEKEKYLNYYFDSICFLGKLQISDLKTMVEMKGQGAEYISCSFDPDDEDTMVVVENSMFYKYLLQVCENHITKYQDDDEKIQEYLTKIKMQLNI